MATAGSDTRVVPASGNESTPYKEQIPFMGIDRPYYGFISGSGAGKTFAGVYRLWLNATVWNPDSMGAIIVPDKSQFTDNVKPIMEEFGLMDKWDYNSVYTDEPGLVTANGQRILILSADNERQIGRIKGKNLAYVWMDEEAEIPKRAREIADQRLRVGAYPNLFITTTPDGRNHTYDFFKGDEPGVVEEVHGKGKLFKTDDKLAIVGVPSEANPAMDEEDIERMRRNLPDSIVAQEIDGEFIEVAAGVFKRDMFTFIEPDDINGDWRMQTIIGVDPAATAEEQVAEDNDSDYWGVCVVHAHSRTNSIFVTDTEQRRGMTLSEGVEWVQQITRNASSPQVVVESNQAQRWLQQSLQDAGVNAIPVQTTRNKEQKLVDLSIPLENDTVQFVDWHTNSPVGSDHPYQELVSELLAFPEGSHDDLADALYLCVDHAPVSWGTSIIGGDAYGRDEE